MSVFKSLVGFVSKYAAEAAATANALSAIADALPLNRDDKSRVKAQIAELAKAPASIADWLKSTKEPAPVQIKASDIEKAVSKVLPGLVEKELAKITDAAAKAKASGEQSSGGATGGERDAG